MKRGFQKKKSGAGYLIDGRYYKGLARYGVGMELDAKLFAARYRALHPGSRVRVIKEKGGYLVVAG